MLKGNPPPSSHFFFLPLFLQFLKKTENFGGGGGLNPSPLNTPLSATNHSQSALKHYSIGLASYYEITSLQMFKKYNKLRLSSQCDHLITL